MILDAASYYKDLTSQYLHYGGDAVGWHYGIWEPDVHSQDMALRRSNELLLRDLNISSSTKLLDVGFGAGGFSVWAATNFGAQVTGITICEDHIAIAQALAERHGVTENCRFEVMDMDALGFDSNHFDVVVNQETACYAQDKAKYIQQVHRVLKPHGFWRNLDFSIQPADLSVAADESYQDVCEGFHIPSLASVPALETLLTNSGFEAVDCRDITPQVLPTAKLIRRLCYTPMLARQLHIDWLLYSRDPSRRRNRQGHIRAAHRFSRGLESGVFRYAYCSAQNPG